MQIANQPAIFHIPHDVLDRGKGHLGTGRVTHSEPNTGQQLIDQHQQCQRAKVVPEIEIFRRVVFAQVRLDKG